MHIAATIAGGLALLAGFVYFARSPLFAPSAGSNRARAHAARAFVPVWFVLALAAGWFGFSTASYPPTAEAPIAALVFLIPAAAAFLLYRHFMQQGER